MISTSGRVAIDPRKRNLNRWLTDERGVPLLEARVLSAVFDRRMAKLARSTELASEALFAGLRYVQQWHTLLSVYEGSGSVYGPHRDASWVTCSLMLHDPSGRRFQGGDFLLGDFSEEVPPATVCRGTTDPARVSFVNNRLVVFPGLARHWSEPIVADGHGLSRSRVTLQFFPSLT